MKRRHALKLLCTATLLPRVAAGANVKAFEETRPLMGTLFQIKTYSGDSEKIRLASAEAFSAAEAINEVASDYIADSELLSFSKLPHGEAYPVSPLLLSLLIEAKKFAVETQGAFDPTLGPLTKLWRSSRRRSALPSEPALQAAMAASGYEKLELDKKNSSLTFTVPDMRLDLGGIAKGQAADAMLAVFKKYELYQTSITCGGDVRVGSAPPERTHWTVEVNDAKAEQRTLKLVNAAVSTSGDTHQFIEINGQKYSHILDPKTGLGLTEERSATIIAATAAESDAMATAACVRG